MYFRFEQEITAFRGCLVVIYVLPNSTWDLFPPGYCELPSLYFSMYIHTRTRTRKQIELYPQLAYCTRTVHVTLKFSSALLPANALHTRKLIRPAVHASRSC